MLSFPINMKRQYAILVALLLCGMATSLHAQTPSTLKALAAESITAGFATTCAIQNGAAKCWGDNREGNLGDGSFTPSDLAIQVVGLTAGVTAITKETELHRCAIQNGAAKCWGDNGYGKLGRGFSGNGEQNSNGFNTPQLVIDLETSVTVIAVGQQHTCAVQDGAAKCWGNNNTGQLGNGSTNDAGRDNRRNRSTPQLVVGLSTGVMAIAAGGGHTCAVHNSAAKCWGVPFRGRLGNGFLSGALVLSAKSVRLLSTGVTAIATGDDYSCAIQNGAAKCWGANLFGQLGDDSRANRGTPVQVIGLSTGVTAIATGDNHSCAIQGGEAKCWGRNQVGQLGNNKQSSFSKRPVQVEGLTADVTVISVAGGRDLSSGDLNYVPRRDFGHSCAIHQGFAKCWGSNFYGQLGNGEESITDPTVDRSSPVFVLEPTVPGKSTQLRSVGVTANSIEVGWNPPANKGSFSIEAYIVYWRSEDVAETSERVTVPNYEIVELQSDTVYQIEVAAVNRVGTGERSTEIRVQTELDLLTAQSITAGSAHSCALANGAARCWGNNENGRLGEAISPRRTRPGQVVGLTSSVTVIAAGGSHSCAVQNGAAKCWGANLVRASWEMAIR